VQTNRPWTDGWWWASILLHSGATTATAVAAVVVVVETTYVCVCVCVCVHARCLLSGTNSGVRFGREIGEEERYAGWERRTDNVVGDGLVAR